MRVPYSWLAEWTAIPWDARELGGRLTMSGFELESLEPSAPPFTGVIVAEILAAEPHPRADKLQVCSVSVGSGTPLQIVCGASNARAGLKSALATVGARLPGGVTIDAAKLRGVESQGMLASARELGLAEAASGILELPVDAPVGETLREYLKLDEPVLDLNITANRGDVMSVLGVAREVSALTGKPLTGPAIPSPKPRGTGSFPVRLADTAGCPRFAGCIVRGVDNRVATPLWMRERLRRAGLRSITPVVDITNYVMLELGQPMHAYNAASVSGVLTVRLARSGEELTLLDERRISLAPDELVIADDSGPIGLAGIMG